MDWLQRMNRAIDLVENNLEDSLDLDAVAKTAFCSLSHFQRLFSFLGGISLAEYIRNRRLAEAACALKTERMRVTDLALKYGYESPQAFTRAFRAFHGHTPSQMRLSQTRIRCFPRISFQVQVKGGGVFMGQKALVRIEQVAASRVVAFRARGTDPEDKAWQMLRAWATANLTDYAYRRCIGFAPQGHHPEGKGSDEHAYVAQMFLLHSEGAGQHFRKAAVTDGPTGLFLISDVPFAIVKPESGAPDIGLSLQRTSQTYLQLPDKN